MGGREQDARDASIADEKRIWFNNICQYSSLDFWLQFCLSKRIDFLV